MSEIYFSFCTWLISYSFSRIGKIDLVLKTNVEDYKT